MPVLFPIPEQRHVSSVRNNVVDLCHGGRTAFLMTTAHHWLSPSRAHAAEREALPELQAGLLPASGIPPFALAASSPLERSVVRLTPPVFDKR